MTALAFAPSQYSDGSEFAMSDLSMLDFVRDLNGQSVNKITVDEIPYDVEVPSFGARTERSLSPDLDLVPTYFLGSSAQLLSNSSGSLTNHRPEGHFRKKLSSLGTTFFSRSGSSGVLLGKDSDIEVTAANVIDSQYSTSKDEENFSPGKKGFVLPARAEALVKKFKRGSSAEPEAKQENQWIRVDTALDFPDSPLADLLQHVGTSIYFPEDLIDPLVNIHSVHANTLQGVPHSANVANPQNSAYVQNSPNEPKTPFAGEIVNVPTDDTTYPESPGLINPSKAQSKAKLKTKKVNKQEKARDRKKVFDLGVAKAIAGHVPPGEQQEKATKEKPVEKSTNTTIDDKQKFEKGVDLPFAKLPKVENTEDSKFAKMKAKSASPPAQRSARPSQEEKPKWMKSQKVKEKWNLKEKVKNCLNKEAERAPRKKGNRNIGSKPKTSTLNKEKEKPMVKSPLSPTHSLPKVRTPTIPLPKTDPREGRHADSIYEKTEPGRSRNALRRPKETPNFKAAEPAKTHTRSVVSLGDSCKDRDAELQFSPFVVSGVPEHAKKSNTSAHQRLTRKAASLKVATRNNKSKNSLVSTARNRTSTSTLLPQWAKLPDTLRSGTSGLSPMQRLTTIFSGPESQGQSGAESQGQSGKENRIQRQTNTVPESAVFSPRESGKTWQEKPTVQSLGDIFAKSGKTATFQIDRTKSSADPVSSKWRAKFKLGFFSSKEPKLIKVKGALTEREKHLAAARERKPKGILKTPSGVPDAATVLGRSEVGRLPASAKLTRCLLGGPRSKGVLKKVV